MTAPTASADLPEADAGVREGVINTVETNCFETGDRRPVPKAEVEAYLPDRYRVNPAFGANVAAVGFQDYVCQELSVNGHQARPTIVSLGVVAALRCKTEIRSDPCNGVPTTYLLWVGTDNPIYFARLQQLGVETFFIPQSTYTETTNLLGQRQITVEYVSRGPGGLDYTRNIVVVSGAENFNPVESTGVVFYHLGSRGEVSFTYANSVDSAARALISFDLGNDSLPLDYGITDFTFPNPRMFYRGSWNGTIQLLT